MIDPLLLEILACPRCEDRPALRLEEGRLICDQCHHAYVIENGIPNLLPECAIDLSQSNV